MHRKRAEAERSGSRRATCSCKGPLQGGLARSADQSLDLRDPAQRTNQVAGVVVGASMERRFSEANKLATCVPIALWRNHFPLGRSNDKHMRRQSRNNSNWTPD